MAERAKAAALGLPFVLLLGLQQDQPQDPDHRTKARSAKDGQYISWREHLIDGQEISKTSLRGGDGLVVIDLDRDGHLDVVSVHEDSNHVRIAFGSKDPDKWTNVTLASGQAVAECEDVVAGDMNGDGCTDLVVACESGNVTYFEAPAKTRRVSAWKATQLSATLGRGSWIRVQVADIDQDGSLDIIGTNKAKQGARGTFSVFFCEDKTTDPDAWKETVVGRAAFPVINARPIDMDQDGDLDIVGASWGQQTIWWFENLKKGASWKKHLVHSGNRPVAIGFMLEFADIDGDGDIDIVSGTGPRFRGKDQIHWFENPRKPEGEDGKDWKPHLLGSIHPDRATGLRFVDLNEDGRLDLFVGGYSWEPWDREPKNPKPGDSCGRLAWFEMPKDPKDSAQEWIRHDLCRRRRGMFDVFAVHDMNGDGLLDIVTTRGNSGEYDGVIWLEQVRTKKAEAAFRPARKKDSPEVALPGRR
ncbi:MAG: VCBS repeat-containing protein [Planctomycetota bacterium]